MAVKKKVAAKRAAKKQAVVTEPVTLADEGEYPWLWIAILAVIAAVAFAAFFLK